MTGPDKLTHGNTISRELTSSVPQSRSRNYVQQYRNEAKANESQGKEEIVSNRFIFLYMPQLFTEIGRENRSSLETRADRTIANRPRIARTSKGRRRSSATKLAVDPPVFRITSEVRNAECDPRDRITVAATWIARRRRRRRGAVCCKRTPRVARLG